MHFAVIRGEYPFDHVVTVVEAPADQPEIALAKTKKMFDESDDFFLRHPVVEPIHKGSLVA